MKFTALSLAALVSSSAAFAPSFVSRVNSPNSVSNSGISSALEMAAGAATRRPFISGNWKLNPQSKTEATTLAADIAATVTSASPDTDIALFVPYVFIETAMEAVGGKLQIGAEVSAIHILTQLTNCSNEYLSHIDWIIQ
jgi:triosephosphate isomerase